MNKLLNLPADTPHYVWPVLDDSVDRALLRQAARSLSDRDGTGVIGEFEDAFRQFTTADYAVSFSSGTGALHALAATQMPPGSKIIAPAYTFFATATPFAYEGVEVVFADAGHAGNVTAATLADAYTPDVAAVVVTHMWGMACEMEAIVEFCRERSLLLFEDCSHAHFGLVDGRRVGVHGDAAVFSTNQKAITSGEGGVLVTNNPEIHQAALLFGHYNKRCFKEVPDHRDRDMALTGYGLKYRMHTLSAALGLTQLAVADDIEQRRRSNLERIVESIADYPMLETLVPTAPDLHGLYVAGFKFHADKSRVTREAFVETIVQNGGRELDIPGSTKDISGEPLFRRGSPRHPLSASPEREFPGVRAFSESFLKLPLWGYAGDEVYVEAYCEALTEACQQANA